MAHEFRTDGDRIELLVDGEVGSLLQFHDRGDVRTVLHTETADGFEGQGLAGELVEHVLADLRAAGKGLLPVCPYVQHYLTKHPDDVELVPADRRAEFGL